MADKTRYKVTAEIISTTDSEFNTVSEYDVYKAICTADGEKIEWCGEYPDDPIYIEEFVPDNPDESSYLKIDPDGTVHHLMGSTEYYEGLED